MISRLTWIMAALLFCSLHAFSQAKEYGFQFEVLLSGSKTKAAANIIFLFNGSRQSTNTQGMAYITLDNRKTLPINIRPVDEREYTIVGNETIYLPPSADIITTITIVRSSQKEAAAAEEITKLYRQQNMDRKEMDSIRRVDQAMYTQMLSKQDTILKTVMKNFKVTETELRSARELMEGRDKYFGIISGNLEGYLNEAKDVRDAFQNLVMYSLENPKSFKLLDSTIEVYNQYYNQLNNTNAECEKAVQDYWKSYELAMSYHNLVDFSINNIHRASIIPLNASLIRKINVYLNEPSKKKRNTLKQELTLELNSILPVFDNNIGILDVKIKGFITNLRAKRDFQGE
ncbi:hypothetical protein [Chitinophaga sp. GbtcB8]|uniref:hypothetical protein n=1 Tax=Chitinophaga sp. GbtcB8 TaxID=2824753 RepID=UPI001C309FD7|nr:hypothetical protein [Chitinophaga sp. GbtcB8]